MAYVKVYKYKQQVSYDQGETWEDTGEYVPSGDPIGYYDTYEECMAQYRTIQSGYTCVGYDKHNQDVYEVSYDNGVTWSVVSTSAGTLIEANSPDCGYVPPTPCECSAFTFDATSHTITDTAQSVTFNYSGCTKPDLSSASTYNWMLIANHEYNAETTVGYITANVSANTNSARTGILYTSLSGSTCQNLVISQQAPTPTPTFNGKYKLTLNDSSTVSAACDSSSAITSGNVATQYSGTVTSAIVGNCVKTISDEAFYKCSGLVSIVIPDSVTSIGAEAFWGCSGLTNIVIPDSVTSIGEWCFDSCSGLTSLTVSSSITTIKARTFSRCTGLTSIIIPDSVTGISGSAFSRCTSLSSVTIGSSVKNIGSYVFNECTSLLGVDIPNSTKTIGNSAFSSCSGLTSITILATTPPTLGTSVFDNTNNCPIYVPSASVNTYKSASGWRTYADRIQAIP